MQRIFKLAVKQRRKTNIFHYLLLVTVQLNNSWVIWGCTAHVFATQPAALEAVVLDTQVNQQAYSQQFFFLDAAKRIYVTPETLQALGFKAELWQNLDVATPFALASLYPQVTYQFDEVNVRLLLTADAQMFAPQVIRVQPTPSISTQQLIQPEPLSGFLNYQLESTQNTAHSDFRLPWEVGVKYHHWLFYSNFMYQTEPHHVTRLLSNVTWDREASLTRWVFGDFAPVLQPLSNASVLTGISIRRFFAQQANFSSLPEPLLRQLFNEPAQIEMYMNDELLDSWSVKPGEVLLTDFLRGAGQGEVRLKIKDAFGQERFLQQAFLLNQNLLKPGLHDYAYQLGWERRDFTQRSLAFGDPIALAQHRYGLSDTLTAGMAFVAKPHAYYVAPSLTWVWNGHLQSDLAWHYRQQNGRSGIAANAFTQYQDTDFNLHLGIDAYTQDYYAEADENRLKQRIFAGFSLPNRYALGNLSVFVDHSQFYAAKTQQSISLNYQNQLFKHVDVLLTTRYQTGTEQDVEIFAGLNYRFDKDWRVHFQHSQNAVQQNSRIDVYKPIQQGLDNGYRVQLQHSNTAGWQANGRWQAHWQYGELDARYLHHDHAPSSNLSWAGGIAWLPDAGLHFSRPINDSFALVSSNTPNIPIQLGGQVMGYSDANGALVLPQLAAFYENRISIDVSKLPLNYTLENAEHFVKPSDHSGAKVDFAITKFAAVEGILLFHQQPIEQAPMQLQVKQQTLTALVGKAGYFYLENLPVGNYRGKVIGKQFQCEFVLDIPDTQAIVQYLGEINCE